MYTVRMMPEFRAWLSGMKDRLTKLRLARRLERAQRGNLGDVKQLGSGVWEMREHFGPGFRMYFARRGDVLIVMLGGGDKHTQKRDMERAVLLAEELED